MTHFTRLALIICLLQAGCSAPTPKPVQEKAVQQEEPSEPQAEEQEVPEAAKNPEQTIAGWVSRNLGVELKDETFEKAGITDLSKFSADIPPKMKADLFDSFYLGDSEKGDVEVKPGVVYVNMGTDDIKDLFITEKYVLISAHLSMGNNGSSLLYNLETRKLERLNMNVEGFLEPDVLNVWFDYYEEGHVWEYGTYDILTKAYKKLRKES